MGGLARRASAVRAARSEYKNVLLVDSGSTLLGEKLANRTQGRVLVDAMSSLGYDAMVVGRGDLRLGREVLVTRASEASFAFVSANLVDSRSGQPAVHPYYLTERAGVRIAIVGLSSQADLPPDDTMGLRVVDPVASARDVVRLARSEAAVVVVLSRLGTQMDQYLASEVPGISAIIGSGAYAPDREAWVSPATGTVVVRPGAQGEHLGLLHLVLDSDGVPVSSQWRVLRLEKSYADDPAMVDLIRRHVQP